MPFLGRPRAVLRDQLLAAWSSQYAARGERLATAPGSDVYLQASAFAVMLEGLESQAEQTARDILPNQASPAALNRHGLVDGVTRAVGRRASCTVTVSGPAAGLVTLAPGTQMVSADGTLYGVENASVTLAGGAAPYTGTITVTATLAGASGSRAVADTLTFVATPAGLTSTGRVASAPGPVPGTDAELDADYARRIMARRSERPASGNRADWQAWTLAYLGTSIANAYVYPLLLPPSVAPGAGTPATPGCVTVVAMGPAQGASNVNLRIVPLDDASTRTAGASLGRVTDYLDGLRDVRGLLLTDGSGTQLRPVTMVAGNYGVEAITTQPQDVLVRVFGPAGTLSPFAATPFIVAGSTATSLILAGDQRALAGLRALIFPTVPAQRGTWEAHTLGSAPSYSPGLGQTTFDQSADPMLAGGIPLAGSVIGGAPAAFEAMRAAVFAFFDTFGPGDTAPPSRWPAISASAPSTLYPSALAAALIDSPATGIVSAIVVTPNADVLAPAKTVVTLRNLAVTY